jgi:uncharacterized membrane protein HdeD (DUF308 family)
MTKHSADRAHQAFRILQFVFVLLLIIAGLDKFFYLLTDWSDYLSPRVWNLIDDNDQAFFIVFGIVELIVGLGVLFKPRIFAYLASILYLLCAVNLVMLGGEYYDMALGAIGLMLSAFALGKLAHRYDV